MPEKNNKNCLWGTDCGDDAACQECTDFTPLNDDETKETFYINDLKDRQKDYAEIVSEYEDGVRNT